MTEPISTGAAQRALKQYLDIAGHYADTDSGEAGPMTTRPTFRHYSELMEWAKGLPDSDPRMQQLAMVVDDSTHLFEVASDKSMAIGMRYQVTDPTETPDSFLDRLTASLVQDLVESVIHPDHTEDDF